MKAIRTLLIGIMMLIGTSAFAQPMNYNAIRNNARFLTDRMAYTLGITSMAIIDDLYRINYDYITGVNYYLDDVALGYRYDDYMEICYERDLALRMLLGNVIWDRLITYEYFYRPIFFENARWRFGIYAYDYNRNFYHYSIPRYYDHYRGGHYFGGMNHNHGIGQRGPGMAHAERRGSYRDHNRVANHPGTPPNRGGMDRGGTRTDQNSSRGERRDMGRGDANHDRDNVNRGENRTERRDVNRGENNRPERGNANHDDNNRTERRDMNRGESNRPERGNMDRGSSRTESNTRSSSRSESPRTAPSTPSRSGSYGGSASTPSRGGSYGGGASSRGGNGGGAVSHGRR